MRPSSALGLATALLTAAPAMGAPVAGLAWMSICTAHGVALLPVPLGEKPEHGVGTACHAFCTLPRRAGRVRGGCN